jgi:diguanylate cyclase (GGDEF)-like protein/PAS domain S-box-containing protein
MPKRSPSTKRDDASSEVVAAPSRARPLNKPLRLIAIIFVSVFISVFVSETAVMFFLTSLPPLPDQVKALIDATLLSLLLAPVLFVFLYKPLRQSIEQRDRAIQSLMESDKRFHDIAENANEWIWEVNAEGKYTYASPIVEKILGYPPDEILEKHFYDLFHPDDRDAVKDEAFKVFASKEPFRAFINRNVHKNGKSVWLATSGIPLLDENGELLGYRGADTVKQDESAITDMLTGLLDREGFFLFAGQQLRIAIRNNLQVALLFADMDNLKAINDEFGHAEGDRALIDVAQILKNSVRESDTVARFGGDEFVVFLTGSTTTGMKQMVAKNIEKELDTFNTSKSRNYQLSISIGLALHDLEHPSSLDELLSRADNSMYEHKKKGR